MDLSLSWSGFQKLLVYIKVTFPPRDEGRCEVAYLHFLSLFCAGVGETDLSVPAPRLDYAFFTMCVYVLVNVCVLCAQSFFFCFCMCDLVCPFFLEQSFFNFTAILFIFGTLST